MSTYNIRFHDKISKYPYIFVFLIYRENFLGTRKLVRIIHGKPATRVRVIEIILYWSIKYCLNQMG